jgi:genome maintenance exonuclease 1
MYIPKFDYKDLSRTTDETGKRLYQTPDGRRVPSVTTILSATQPAEKKQALRNWRKSIGVERAQAITTEAANRGTRMHKYLEDYIRNGVISERGSNPYSWASHKMAQTVIEDGLKNVNEIWGIEIPLYFPQMYAGTTDGCGVHMGDESILDYKQTNKPKKLEWIDDYFLQLVAYALAHNEVYGTKIRKGVVLMCVKPTIDPATMEPTDRPQYQEFILEPKDFDHWEQVWWKRLELYYTIT